MIFSYLFTKTSSLPIRLPGWSINCPFVSGLAKIFNLPSIKRTSSIIYTDTWQIGDKVLMIPIMGDDNKTVKQFWILSKGKRLDGN